MKPLEHGAQWICFDCGNALLKAADLPDPLPMWCHTAECELCGKTASVSKARNFGLPAREKPEPWQAT